ncbi:MAG: ral stress protein [Labilithrix sp.]|nr:ral stress protein [Labilithrix sp.]
MMPDEKTADENVESKINEGDSSTSEGASAQNVEAAPEETAGQEAARPRRRGFAAMDRDRVKEIASKGGRAAHAAGTAHQFSSDEARNAGRKGGMAPHVRRGGTRRRPAGEVNGPASRNVGDGETR